MKPFLLILALAIAAGHVNASTSKMKLTLAALPNHPIAQSETLLSDHLTQARTENECLSILESLGNESEALIDQCMDQDYSNN